MRSLVEKILAQKWKSDGKSYNEIASNLKISKQSARNLCVYKCRKPSLKRGPKFKIDSKAKLRIKREISYLKNEGMKVNSPKLIRNCNLNVSKWTCQRYMKRVNYKYTTCQKKLVLSKKHREERIKLITKWISSNHLWEKTIFSDEKRFSLDGPDDWRTYVAKEDKCIRQKRQCNGGGIMIWLMVMPNGLLCHKVIQGKFKSHDYINLLKQTVVPIVKLNFENNFYFQEDNCMVHKAKDVKDFWKRSNIKVLEWPAKSPDLNITEDIWKVISDSIYDRPQFNSTKELIKAIDNCIFEINLNRRQLIMKLYDSIRSRLCKVLNKKGNLYNE